MLQQCLPRLQLSLVFVAQAKCQIGMMVWPPAWALLCLGQVGGEGGSPSQAGRMPPAPQEEGGFRALG